MDFQRHIQTFDSILIFALSNFLPTNSHDSSLVNRPDAKSAFSGLNCHLIAEHYVSVCVCV